MFSLVLMQPVLGELPHLLLSLAPALREAVKVEKKKKVWNFPYFALTPFRFNQNV